MLVKLAWGNARRAARDFSVYFLTLVFAVCLLYSFLASSDYLLALSLTDAQRASFAKAGEVLVEAITLNYGNLIMAILTFLIDAFVIFTVLRIVRRAQKRMKETAEELREKLRRKGEEDKQEEENTAQEEAPAAPAPAPAPTTEELLAEIRDLLKEQQAKTADSDKKWMNCQTKCNT